MQQFASAIRENIDLLVDRYDADLRKMPGYDHLPEARRHDLERHVLNLIAQCAEAADYAALVQYVLQRATQWETAGLPLSWFQQALVIPEEILKPLIRSVEASNFLWQALNRSQNAVWQMVADRAHQTEERFRSIVETSHSGVLIIDDAFRLTYANDELASISGYDREELRGVDFRKLLDEESRNIAADRYVRRQRGEDVTPRYEIAFLRKDGTKRYVEMSAVSLKDLNGKPYTVAQVLDVSERRQTEQVLRESEAQYRNAIAAADAVPYFIDYQTESYRFIGERIEDLTGYPAQEVTPTLLGQMIQETVMTGTGSGLARAEAIQKTRAGEAAQWNADYRLVNRHGATRWLSDSSVQVLDEQGKPIGAIGILQDITARKQIESTLQESEERFRRFSEATTEGLVFHDKGVILDANPAIVTLFGFATAAEFIGRNLLEFIVPDSHSLVLQKMQLDDVHPYEVQCVRKDGSTFPAETSTRMYRHGEQTIRASAVRDITARKQAEDALARSAEKQQQLTQRLRATIEATDELMRLPDLDTVYRRAVELARERFGVERCGLFIADPTRQFMLGTYGTDDQGQTTDEHAAREPIERHPTLFLSQERTWVVQEAPQSHWDQAEQKLIGTGWIGGTAIRSESGPIGVMYNDAAISQSPLDPDLQETLAIYCSMLGNIIERKQLEQQISESLSRRSIQVQTSVEVAQHVAAAPELGELFHRVVTLVKERFNYYHAQLFRYVPTEDVVELITGYGEVGQRMLAARHRLAMGRGVVGTAAATGQSILATDVARDLDWRPNPNLPDTKGELAIPIKLGSGDPESQAHALKHFVNGSYDGIAVAAIDPEAVADITRESLRQGKPVMAISVDLGSANQTAAIFSVEHEVGYLLGMQAGTWAKHHVPDQQIVKVGLLTCRTLPNVVERERGIIDGIRSVIGARATIVASESALEPKMAAFLAEGWLRDFPDLDMIVAYNDATALGAYQAVQNTGRHDPDQFFVGGIDAVPEALDAIQQGGVYQATVNQPPEVMGIMAVRTLIAAIKGVSVKPAYTLYCAPVNRSNVAEFTGPSRAAAVQANQDIISAEALSGFDVSGLRLGLSVLTLANPFFATLADSAQKEAQRLGVQLMVNDPSQILGVLDVQSDQANTLTDDDRLLLEGLCGQIASAMASTRLLEQLRRNEAELSDALQIAKLGYWEYDVEKDLFHFNDQFYSIFHTTAEQEGGYQLSSAQYAQKFVHPDDLPIVGTEIERALNSTDRHYSRDLVHRINYADGGVGYISVSINIDRDEQGRILRYYGANQDITERQLAEEAIRRSEAQLSEALKIAKLAYWEYDVEKDRFFFNDQFYSLFHTTAEQVGGYQISSAQYAQQFVYPDDLPIVGVEIERALNSTDRRYSRDLVHRILYDDGGVGYITVNINIDRDEQGHILRYYGANQDITERKQIEETLRQNEAQLSEALRIAQLASWEYDVASDTFTFNDRFYALLRTTAEREGGYTMSSAEYTQRFVHPDDAPLVGHEVQLAIETADPNFSRELDHRIFYADGQLGYVTVRFSIEKDAQGRTIKTRGANQDITDRKQAEAERERLLAEQQRHSLQLQTASEVSRAASSILKMDDLLPQAAELIRARFNLYYVGIFLLDEAGRWATLRAGTGEAGQNMLANNHKLKIGGNSMISQCVMTQQARIALDVGEEAVRFDNPLLPLTRSEMALPLISRGQTMGAVTIQSDQPAAFSADDITVLQSMADQISNAVENARLYEQAQTALQEVDAINRRLTGEAWSTYLHQQAGREVIWLADDESAAPQVLPEMDEQLTAGEITLEPEPEDGSEATVTAPILLRGQSIGALRLRTPVKEWGPDTEAMLADIAGHIAQAVENARLVEQTQRTAERERLINEINSRVRQTVTIDSILDTAVKELGKSLAATHVFARIAEPAMPEATRDRTEPG